MLPDLPQEVIDLTDASAPLPTIEQVSSSEPSGETRIVIERGCGNARSGEGDIPS